MENRAPYQSLTPSIFNQKVINETQPTVLIFGTDWSGNAEIMNSVLEKVSLDYRSKILFFSVDIEKLPAISDFFGIFKVPTIIFIKEGEVLNKIEGLVASGKLKRMIEDAFGDII